MFGIDHYEAVLGLLAEYDVPVIMDLDIGHIPPMMPMINGVLADVTVQENDIQIAYQF